MKKYFSFFAAAAMACCAVASCSKDDPKDNNGDNGNNNDNNKPSAVAISIDGDFSDWDAIKETSEDGTVYFCATGADGYKNIRNLKATSDEDYIYMCFEVSTSKLYMGDGGHHGDSWEGLGTNNAAPAPIWIYIDSDNNSKTGLTTQWVGDVDAGGPAFSDFQCDNFIQIYNWIERSTGVWDMGWQQCNVRLPENGCTDKDGKPIEGPKDGDSIEDNGSWYNYYTDVYVDGYGWSHFLDNTIITFENFKTKNNGAYYICEFAIKRSLLVDNDCVAGPDMTEIAFGVANQCNDPEGGKGGWSGIIPGDRKPATLKLVN
ncbi:MAG: hypothetical protein NC335_10265 [Bacteroides sp.]|nr:hypothetical protein [Bacteroides sp.]